MRVLLIVLVSSGAMLAMEQPSYDSLESILKRKFVIQVARELKSRPLKDITMGKYLNDLFLEINFVDQNVKINQTIKNQEKLIASMTIKEFCDKTLTTQK